MIRLLCAMTATFFSTVANSELIPGSTFESGHWTGAAYTKDTDGTFSHCVVSAEYVSGDTLYLSVTNEATVDVAVSGKNLALIPGQEIQVTLNIDRKPPFQATAIAKSEDFAVLVLPDFDRALTTLKKGYVLRVSARGRSGEYSLKGTFNALEQTRRCAVKYFEYAAVPNVLPGGVSRLDPSIVYQLATGMITELG